VNVLRLFSARASDELDMKTFNAGDYQRAVAQKMAAETVSKVLYPTDDIAAGKELRLIQEYFLCACAVRDLVRRHLAAGRDIAALADHVAIQLNDTHPALTVAELMRVLVDEHGLGWEPAWTITRATLAYTNHTLLPEALERWDVALVEKVLPRHLQLIYEINRRFLEEVAARFPGDDARIRRMSIIEEGQVRRVRMAYLSIVGGHAVNGVAAIHSELVKTHLVPDFHAMWPERFQNKTNGVTPRRWLAQANPGLAGLITEAIGPGWVTDLDALRGLEPLAADAGFREKFLAVKRANKARLAEVIRQATGTVVDPLSLFDVQIKRIHEYKRQLLNALHIIYMWRAIVEDGVTLAAPRTCVFAGKAAPGYRVAKKIIHLVNALGRAINDDPRVRGQLKVVFLPDYRVTLAEDIVPAADLSEQISTAGKEASGTGNMKLSMNGALTIGTLDGANVEIRDQVGAENIFIFGLTVEEVEALWRRGYDPQAYRAADPRLARVLDVLGSERVGPFRELHDRVAWHDEYLHQADFASYAAAQARAGQAYTDASDWTRMAILNVARMGQFSSDRTIREYAREIWNLRPVRG
jgi:starch phosphorylase